MICDYELFRLATYMRNLMRSRERGIRHAAEEEHLPDWIDEHVDLLRCPRLSARMSPPRLRKMLARMREQYRGARKDSTARGVRQLAKIAGLSRLDVHILEVLIRYKTQPVIESMIDQVDRRVRYYVFNLRNPTLAGLLGVSVNAIQQRVTNGAPLVRSGLVAVDGDNDIMVSRRVRRLANVPDGADQDVTSLLLGEPVCSELEWRDFKHLGADRRQVRDILHGALSSDAAGVNVLLHGPPGSGKTELAKVLAANLGVKVFSVGEEDDRGNEPTRLERLQELKTAQVLLAGDRNSILLFDEMEDILGPESDWMAHMIGSSSARGSEGSTVFLNRMLEQCRVPTIWTISSNACSVSPVILRRMMFALAMRLPPPKVRASIWQRQLDRHGVPVTPADAAALAREFPVTPGVAEAAIRAAALTEGGIPAVRRGVTSLVRVLPVSPASEDAQPPERYDLSLIAADTDLDALTEQIVGGDSPRFSMLLMGPPGTGKSAYARYLADRLGMPVLHKRASDLLSHWVGGTEQQIAAAFREANDERKFLVIDEADSLLADRRRAQHNWEVSHVNEMLTWMERHPLPFAFTTNLDAILDPATQRRFLFKVTLRYLTAAKAEAAFRLYFDRPAPPEVATLANLTPADFDVVRKQAAVRGCLQDPARLAELLRAECQAKHGPTAHMGFQCTSAVAPAAP